jgi:hypothetical protein
MAKSRAQEDDHELEQLGEDEDSGEDLSEEEENEDDDEDDDEAPKDIVLRYGSAAPSAPEPPAAPPAASAAAAAPKVKRPHVPVVQIPGIGQRPADVTHWRCRRVAAGSRTGGTLATSRERGEPVELHEWPIRQLSLRTLIERWGAGWYVIEYYRVDARGRRTPRGRSSPIHLVGRGGEPAPAPAPLPPPAQAPSMLGEMTGVMQLLAFLEERAERSRASARAEMQLLLERHRTDTELTMERERLASKERLAQFEAMQRQARTPESEVLDRLDQVASRLDELEAKPPDNGTAAILNQAAQLVGPLVMAFASKLSGPGMPPSTPPHSLN